MNFVKLFAAGRDYIFLNDKNAFEIIKGADAVGLCDRKKGIGADGIFSLLQKDGKNSQIKGFWYNGEIMQDFSAASICAAFVLLCEKNIKAHTFSGENGEFFIVSDRLSDNEALVSCDMGKGEFNLKYPAIKRKTQLGNRILTLTAVKLHGIHTVHFSECKDMLDLIYLGEKVSRNSLFEKRADFVLCQKNGTDLFEIDYYENNTGYRYPVLSAFTAAALCACKTGEAEYNEEIRISCKDSDAFVVCKENNEAILQCTVRKVFEGKL